MAKPIPVPSTFDEALGLYITHLESDGGFNSRPVPSPTTIRLIARLNAACARNMNATNWFPHHRPKR